MQHTQVEFKRSEKIKIDWYNLLILTKQCIGSQTQYSFSIEDRYMCGLKYQFWLSWAEFSMDLNHIVVLRLAH